MIGGDQAMEFVGAMVASPNRERFGLSRQFAQYPPQAPYIKPYAVAAIGAVRQPNARGANAIGYELLIGYRFAHDVFDARSEVEISYTVGEQAYLLTIPARIVVCPTTMARRACEDRGYALFPDG